VEAKRSRYSRAAPLPRLGIPRGSASRHRTQNRPGGAITDHTFEIRLLDPGVQAYAFAFG